MKLDNSLVPLCFSDESHGKMDFVLPDKWECFVCGSYHDSHGGVIKETKFCDAMKGGIINAY